VPNSRSFALYSLAIINFSHIIDSMLIMPMGDIFIKLFDINAHEYSYLVSSYALGAVGSSILAFLYLDRFDRKTSLILLYSGFVVGTLLCGFANSFYVLVSLRFVTGAFGGVIGALAFAVASDLYQFEERGKAMGILMGAFSAASALGVPFGLYLAATYSWRMPFWVLGGLGAVLLILSIWKFPNITKHLEEQKEVSIKRTISLLISDNNQLRALLLGMVLVLGHFMIIPFISPYMIRNVGFTQMEVTQIFLFGGIAMVFSAPLAGRLTDKYGVMKVFSIAIFLSFIPTIAITHMGASPIWYALIFTTLFFIFASSRMIPANTMITASVGNENRGSFMSMKSALQQMAVAIASLISGLVVYIGEDGLYHRYYLLAYVAIFFCLISIWLCSRLKIADGN
jgi:predicted MFS family arabinose efflux permease